MSKEALQKRLKNSPPSTDFPTSCSTMSDPRTSRKLSRNIPETEICHEVLLLKSVPIIVNTRKVLHQHHMFNTMEARAITCFNTGNLVFKDWNPHKFTGKHAGDRWCLFSVCEGRDSYYHVRFECKLYTTKYRDTGDPVKDNADFLVKLDQERIKRWKLPLIVVSGYL